MQQNSSIKKCIQKNEKNNSKSRYLWQIQTFYLHKTIQEPQLVRKAIITGTGPAGGEGIKKVTGITYLDIMRGLFSFKDAKTYLFFNRNTNGKKAAKEFLGRL